MKHKKIKKQKNLKFSRILSLVFSLLILLTAIGMYLMSDKKPTTIRDQESMLTGEAKDYESKQIFAWLDEYYPYFLLNKKYDNFDFERFQTIYRSQIQKSTTDLNYIETSNDLFRELYGARVFIVSKEDVEFLITHRQNFYPKTHAIHHPEVQKAYNHLPPTYSNTQYDKITTERFQNTAYIKIPTMHDQFLASDRRIIEDFLKENRHTKNIILDLRNTQGSSYRYAVENIIQPLTHKDYTIDFYTMDRTSALNQEYDLYHTLPYFNIRHATTMDDLKNFQIDPAFLDDFTQYTQVKLTIKKGHTPQKIYILQNQNTKNAADFVLQFAKKTDFAQTVGTESAGFGLSFCQAYLELPMSHFLLSMPISIGINDDLTINEEYGTIPDIRLPDDEQLLKNILSMIE